MASASPLEVTRDLVVALISRQTGYIGSGNDKEKAAQVADVFEIIHKKVAACYHAE